VALKEPIGRARKRNSMVLLREVQERTREEQEQEGTTTKSPRVTTST